MFGWTINRDIFRCVRKARCLKLLKAPLNKGLHLTASSVRCAPAAGSSSGLAFGCAETNRHNVKECKSPTAKGSPPTLAPSPARASGTRTVKRGQGHGQAGERAPKAGASWVPTRAAHAEGTSGRAARARRPRTWRGRSPLACPATVGAGRGRPWV